MTVERRDSPAADEREAPPGASLSASSSEEAATRSVLLEPASPIPAAPSADPPTLQPGERVGRYTILGQLGQGGMGVVYAAYDPQLDRKVALKLLRLDTEEGRTRLLREAQAMAKVTHPNVVAVYDAGIVEGMVFVAMEFVAGQNLGQWLKAQRRPWREVLAVFREAGRGLTAVHQAGLVHRDFKPENVLIGEDGRCRVSDFGLARTALAAEVTLGAQATSARGHGPSPSDGSSSDSSTDSDGLSSTSNPTSGSAVSLLASSLTQVGTVVGTRSYMAPEQFRGAPPDALTDQFSFAVALYRALYRARPYDPALLQAWKGEAPAPVAREPRGSAGAAPATELGGESAGAEASTASERGEPVPRWVWRTLAPALAPRPQDRYPRLETLLDALGKDPSVLRRQRLGWAAVALSLTTAVAVTVALVRRAGQSSPCQDSGAELVNVWDAPVKQRLREQFLASGAPEAPDAWTRTERILDDYSQRWAQMRTEACVAARVTGVQSDAVLSLRMACLDRRLSGLGAFVQVFSKPDRATVQRAVQGAQGLTPIEGCAEVATLQLPVPPPEDPATRAQVEALRKKLELSNAYTLAGKFAAATELSRTTADDAAKLAYRPLEAESLERLAHSQRDLGQLAEAEKTYQRAVMAAAAGGHVELAALSSARLASLICTELGRSDSATWAGLSRAFIERLGGSDKVTAKLETALGLCQSQVDFEQARPHFERALALTEKSERPDSLQLAITSNNLGWNALERGDYQAALPALERSLQVYERALGPEHSFLGYPLRNLGEALFWLGRYPEARAQYEKSKRILEATGGVPTLWARNLQGLCQLELAEERFQAAVDCARPAREVFERSAGERQQAWAAEALDIEGRALSRLGRHAEAVAAHRRVLAAREGAKPGPKRGALVAASLGALAQSLVAAGQRGEAVRLLQQGQARLEKEPPPTGVEQLGALEQLGRGFLAVGQPKEAAALLERALELRQAKRAQAVLALAETRTLLGRAQRAQGGAGGR